MKSPSPSNNESRHFLPMIEALLERANRVILGKRNQTKLALCTILARGHLLVEDIPGVGKTTLVKFLARALGLETQRIQFTNDLLPADIIGTSVFDPEKRQFHFHPGPLFAQIVIADELNRATPKTQSACLQAMEERTISVDGITHTLPEPFVVVATQNPREQAGTYPLPESQLDRFLMRIELGYPPRDAERELLKGDERQVMLSQIEPIVTPQEVLQLQRQVELVHVSDPVVDYVQGILEQSRQMSSDVCGLSPRAGLALIRASKAWAFLSGRSMVLPEDVQAAAPSVISHRLNRPHDTSVAHGQDLAQEILRSVPVD